MNPHDALQYIDENTIGVMVILGSTYTGHFENVQLMSDLCNTYALSSGQLANDSLKQWTIFNSVLALIFLFMLMLLLVDSLRLSLIRTSNGLSKFRE